MKYRKDSTALKFLICVIFFLGGFSEDLCAEEVTIAVQTTDSVTAPINFTTARTPEQVDFRVPSDAKIKEFKKQKEFDYTEEPPKLNLLQRILEHIRQLLGNMTSGVAASNVLMYPVIIILVILLLFIIFKLLKVDSRRLLGRKKLKSEDDIKIESENVHEMNFEELISRAIDSENYRLAVRYLYLKNLKKLSDNEYIVWNPNKTNTNYVQEIKNEDLKKHFFRTSLIFDYVWYGEMKLDRQTFEIARHELETFEKQLNNER